MSIDQPCKCGDGGCMAGVFKISPLTEGYYQFHLLNGQGDTLLLSPEFDSRETAEAAIQEVRVGSLMSQQIAKARTPDGEWFFLITNNAGQVVAKSGLYDNEMRFDNALHHVKENACIAEITYVN